MQFCIPKRKELFKINKNVTITIHLEMNRSFFNKHNYKNKTTQINIPKDTIIKFNSYYSINDRYATICHLQETSYLSFRFLDSTNNILKKVTLQLDVSNSNLLEVDNLTTEEINKFVKKPTKLNPNKIRSIISGAFKYKELLNCIPLTYRYSYLGLYGFICTHKKTDKFRERKFIYNTNYNRRLNSLNSMYTEEEKLQEKMLKSLKILAVSNLEDNIINFIKVNFVLDKNNIEIFFNNFGRVHNTKGPGIKITDEDNNIINEYWFLNGQKINVSSIDELSVYEVLETQ